MARKKKRGRIDAAVDGVIASSDDGGPAASKRRCIAGTVPKGSFSSGFQSSQPIPPPSSKATRRARRRFNRKARTRSFITNSTKSSSENIPGPLPKSQHPQTNPTDSTSISSTKSWREYFHEVGLLQLVSPQSLARRFKLWNSATRKSLRQNFSRLILNEYTIPTFNLKQQMQDSKRSQPAECFILGFEEENEETLTLIADHSCIIRDNSGTDDKSSEPLVIKIGAMPLLNRSSLPAVPLALTTALLHSTLTYISNCTDSAIVEDPVRHCTDPQATQPTTTPDNLAKSQHTPPAKTRRGGPTPAPPTNRGKCHNIHAQHCARNDNEIDNIRLYRGPVGTWDARTTDQPLHNFLHDLRPLTQLLDIVFKLFLLPCWKKYDKVRRKMPGSLQELSDCFGLWRSRAIVIDACTNVHRDLKDVCYGWCAIVPLGDFEGGDVCLPGLGYKITLPVGSILFLRSYIIPHYIGYWTGHRFSIIHFSHQATFDYYAQERGGVEHRLYDYDDMPGWWQSSRKKDDPTQT